MALLRRGDSFRQEFFVDEMNDSNFMDHPPWLIDACRYELDGGGARE